MPTTPHSLIPLVEKFAAPVPPRIMLVGDVMLDEYIYGDAERLSPEAPVPVVQEKYREQRPGGAGNVATGLAALGAQVLIVSICGNDFQGKLLNDLFATLKVNTDGLLQCPDRPTTSKTRLVGLAQHRHPQQMLRLDQESTPPITSDQQAALLAYIQKQLPTCAALALEDYNKGLLTPDFCQKIITLARNLNKPVLVDPALLSDYSKYDGASTITPNRFEAEKPSVQTISDSIDSRPQLAKSLAERHHLDTCLLTLDRHGMYLYDSKSGGGTPIPTRPRNVYDVTGAGDMVLATITMAIASGASWLQAAHLANLAGGLEVEKFGIVPITQDEIIDELHHLDTDSRGKERTPQQLAKELERLRKKNPNGRGVVFTNGVFDILHAGHAQYLEFARKQGDLLIVGVNSDDSVRQLKGPTRPINPLADRLAVLAALQSVDYVVPFSEDTPAELIATLQPDILIKAADYANKEIAGRDTVEKRGGKVILAPFLNGRSTTATIERMQK